MSAMIFFVAFVGTVTVFVWWLLKHLRIRRLIERIPGPRTYPLIGNAHQYSPDPNEFFDQAGGVCRMFLHPSRMHRIWLMFEPMVILYGAEEAEVILSSNRHLNKSHEYQFLQPWMGLGLLTSYAEKWRPRRKLLTPTFHYDILKDFVEIFNQQSKILVEKMSKHAGKGPFDVYSYVTLCALDIICESAMGRHVNAQQHEDSDYVTAVYKLNNIIHHRQKNPIVQPDFLFGLFGRKKEHDWCLKIVHGFTNKTIEERYEALRNDGSLSPNSSGRKRLAFLDLLIDMAEKNQLTFQDICDEVNTFMFEGHDTTATGMNWALYLLGCDQDIQAKVHQELDSVFGDDSRDVTFDDLRNLPYLECCLKEALRLFPSVPMFARTLAEDATIAGYTVPSETQVIIIPYLVHRDPKHWPEPEVFNPDRFLPESSVGRHPYAYLPFSAGARNCIGQRFALMEEKTTMAWILRYFKIKSVHRRDQIRPKGELILRPSEGVHLELELRRPLNYIKTDQSARAPPA
jgi:cytochrome P450